MFTKSILASACLAAVAISAPAPQVSGYTGADAGFPQTPSPLGSVATIFGPDSQVSYTPTAPPPPGAPGAAPTRVSSDPTGVTSHGPYDGTPTTTGAVSNVVLAPSIAPLPPNPTATYYNADGTLKNAQPAPYTPAGMLRHLRICSPLLTKSKAVLVLTAPFHATRSTVISISNL